MDRDYELAFVLLWAAFIFSGVFGVLSLAVANTALGMLSLSLTAVTTLAFMLVQKGYSNVGKMLVINYTSLMVLAQDVYFGGTTYVNLYFFPIAIVSLIVFANSQPTLGHVTALVATGFLVSSALNILPRMQNSMSEKQVLFDQLINVSGSVFFSLFAVFYLLHYGKKYRVELEEKSEETRLANEGLLAANNTKTRLFSIIGHDLRNPLIAIKGAVSALKEPDFPEEERGFLLSELEKRVDYAMNLMNNLLIWSKAQLNGIEFKPENFDLTELFKTVMSQVQGQAGDKRIDVHTDFQHLPLLVFADKGMMEIVIRNLISNSLKYTHHGGFIRIRARKSDDWVVVTIADSGVGMDSEALQKVRNQIFYTTPGTQKEKGSGLGLMICADFLRFHHSELQIDSGKDSGTRVSFSIAQMLDS